jgi:hypothetical protein
LDSTFANFQNDDFGEVKLHGLRRVDIKTFRLPLT